MIVSNSKAMKYEPNLRKCVKILMLNCRLFVIGCILSIFTTKACNFYIMAQLNLRSRQQCIVYLVTYSHADLSQVPTRQIFANMVVKAFEQLAVARVNNWVVSQENHHDGMVTPLSTHYHMALKLSCRARWCRVQAALESENGIKVNFSSAHTTYYSTYKYLTKEDEHFVVSSDHPELSGPPATEEATKARKAKLLSGKGKKKRKRERYATFDVVEIILHFAKKKRERPCLRNLLPIVGRKL